MLWLGHSGGGKQMRAYFWGNMYMSSIQQGIQSLHCLSEMYVKYSCLSQSESIQNADLFLWAKRYKTVIVLNAGEMCALEKVEALMSSEDNPYAWDSWRESPESLNRALTSVGIILPERMYKGAQDKKKYWRNWENRQKLTEWEIELADLINSTYMAR